VITKNRGTKIISIGARSSISVRDSPAGPCFRAKKRPAIAGLLRSISWWRHRYPAV